ncbi:MAG: hypothetical protein JOZ81_15465, partial [Chloroflexi bacterium]|nr:hypothetical protein [Chloroflexota bacterium]
MDRIRCASAAPGWRARRAGVRFLARGVLPTLVTAGLVLLPVTGAQAAGPGSWTQDQVNAAIAHGVAYLDMHQNANGSYGSGLVAETGMALAAYGVLANGDFSSLPPAYQTHVQNAINFLLANQGPSEGIPGAFSPFFDPTYSTGIALLGLAPFTSVNPAVPGAIAGGRSFLINSFQGPAYTGCASADGSSTAGFCGGWNYAPDKGRSDESNSGFAMTGLAVTDGGIPAALVPDNINWNHHVQAIASNPFTQPPLGGSGFNDGGGGYLPADVTGAPNPFASNANDSGSLLFSYAFDGLPSSDPNVAAAIKFDQDVLNTYEDAKPTYQMVYHTAKTEDGSCSPPQFINSPPCSWAFDGDGGFHYSLFALTKGLGSYIPPDLGDPTNWYANVVDLLLSQQNGDGSWPADARDDYNPVFATALSVSALGLVGVPVLPPPPPAPSCALTATLDGPPAQIQITVQDTTSGLQTVAVTLATNATVDVPSFPAGTTSPVVVTATKVDQTQGAEVALQVTNMAGQVTSCDPAVTV